jgi:hypothetical protein
MRIGLLRVIPAMTVRQVLKSASRLAQKFRDMPGRLFAGEKKQMAIVDGHCRAFGISFARMRPLTSGTIDRRCPS